MTLHLRATGRNTVLPATQHKWTYPAFEHTQP